MAETTRTPQFPRDAMEGVHMVGAHMPDPTGRLWRHEGKGVWTTAGRRCEIRPILLTVDEATALRDAGTADELEAAAQPVRARWVAEALDALADEPAWALGTMMSARVRQLAAEYRDGAR